jgi:hypothetical protein
VTTTRSSNPGKEHHNGTCADDLRGYDFLIGQKAYYRLRPKDKVKFLPADARVAFEKIPGAQPAVDLMGGTFYSVVWTADEDGWPEATRIPRQPGDYLVEDEKYGITIVAAADVVVPGDTANRLLPGPPAKMLRGPQKQLPPPG